MKETAVADILSIFGDGPLASGFWKTTSCLESIELHQAFYYDDYSFLEKFGSRSAALMFDSSEVAGARRDTTGSGLTCRGMLTGSLTRDLETGDMRLSAIYYDCYGNITQTVFENNAGGVSLITNTHDFLGNVLTEKESPSLADGTESLLSRIHKYDRAGRLVQTVTDLDGTDVVTRNTYDPVGRLKMTVVSSGEVSDTTMHTYNVHGWQTSIENDSWSSVMRYQNPEFDESYASFTGNISEWEWTRGNSTDTYSLEYDALSRIKESRLFRNGNLVDALSESGISYDSNGNILSLTRTGEDGSAVNDLTYHYDGNRLECLVDNGELSGNYAYDADGNMTFDGRTGMSMTWNDLGLVEKVSLDGEDLVNYSYLADGTKVSAQNSDGDGLLYLGSLIYRKTGNSIELESAGFAGGRFVARETEDDGKVMVPMLHVTDHLGSVRAVVDGVSGEVVETNDYYPFGSRWDVAAGLKDDTNRFRYNSKEEQFNFGTPYIDYGARQYDPVLGRWFAQDPLSEKYYGISPYAFCAGNPVKYLDSDGRYFDDDNEKKVQRDERKLERRSLKLSKKVERLDKQGKDSRNVKERSKELKKSAQDIRDMRNDTDTEYRFVKRQVPESEFIGINVAGHETIAMYSSNFATLVHEIRHGGQHARGELDLVSKSNYVVEHEVEAYRAQFSWSGWFACKYFNPSDNDPSIQIYKLWGIPYIKTINNISSINNNFVSHIIENGDYLYPSIWR